MYLPLAADPDFHKKQTLTSEEEKFYQADIAFMGAGYPNRRIAFRTLLKYDFKIWGSDWEGDELLARYVQKNGQRISPEESLKIYSATKINLNLHSSIHANKLVPMAILSIPEHSNSQPWVYSSLWIKDN